MESSPVEPEPVDLKTEPAGSHKEPNSAPTVSARSSYLGGLLQTMCHSLQLRVVRWSSPALNLATEAAGQNLYLPGQFALNLWRKQALCGDLFTQSSAYAPAQHDLFVIGCEFGTALWERE